jgi:hypothetical protein
VLPRAEIWKYWSILPLAAGGDVKVSARSTRWS